MWTDEAVRKKVPSLKTIRWDMLRSNFDLKGKGLNFNVKHNFEMVPYFAHTGLGKMRVLDFALMLW